MIIILYLNTKFMTKHNSVLQELSMSYMERNNVVIKWLIYFDSFRVTYKVKKTGFTKS